MKFSEVAGKIFLEVFAARAGVSEDLALALMKLDDGPFIEHHVVITGVHLFGTGCDELVGLVERHGVACCVAAKQDWRCETSEFPGVCPGLVFPAGCVTQSSSIRVNPKLVVRNRELPQWLLPAALAALALVTGVRAQV